MPAGTATSHEKEFQSSQSCFESTDDPFTLSVAFMALTLALNHTPLFFALKLTLYVFPAEAFISQAIPGENLPPLSEQLLMSNFSDFVPS